MTDRIRNLFPSFITGILNSYTQVFFSNNKVFACILVVVTFFDMVAGMSGLIAVIATNLVANLIGFNRYNIKAGYYGFNSLLVGLGLGIFYQPTLPFFVLLIFSAFMTLLLTVMTEGIISKYGLPFLSLSFLLGIWFVTLASRQFSSLIVSDRGIYAMNEMYSLGGLTMVKIYNWIDLLPWHQAVKLYFRSLGAILFQYHLVPGILVATGLLIYSRIAFLLSWIGFFSAYLYYQFIGADFNELSYGYIGFNFILTAIAVGGFFIIPSKYSFLYVILLTPLISIFLTSTTMLFSIFQLSVFSLPFNIIVLLFLYTLKFRERFYNKPQLVAFQQYSPEKNLYSQVNYRQRFEKSGMLALQLPFRGTWKVTQGHDGDLTHKREWRHAWDFEITDNKGLNFSGEGLTREDYYCYHKPVIAAADGWVEELVDDVDENEIGKVNVLQNWGNSIVIRHSDFLFTKLSHLKKGSFKVAIGDHVKKGDVLAGCGNSGRSPVPHLHFQVQSTPFIGSKTFEYPISNFILNEGGKYSLKTFDIPGKDALVSNIEKNEALVKAFHLIPGQKATFRVTSERESYDVSWEVLSDSGNRTYVYCERSRSKAYYHFENDILFFTHFEGDRSSLLFFYYLGAFKILTGYYRGLEVSDSYPLNIMNRRILLFFQDFLAPFWIFMKPGYWLFYEKMEDDFIHSKVWLKARTTLRIEKKLKSKVDFEFIVSKTGLERMIILAGNKRTEASRIE